MRTLCVRALRQAPYEATWDAMRVFTQERRPDSVDELWLIEHPPVYTRGRNARERAPAGLIPTVDTDRGGDLTYHGPGQLVAYTLFDLTGLGIGVRQLVHGLEETVLATLAVFGIGAQRRSGAPGVYVGDAKIASLGLRIRGGRSYHGLALNVAMDLAPFGSIAPCGYQGLRVTQIADLGGPRDIAIVAPVLVEALAATFHYQPSRGTHGSACGSTKSVIARP